MNILNTLSFKSNRQIKINLNKNNTFPSAPLMNNFNHLKNFILTPNKTSILSILVY